MIPNFAHDLMLTTNGVEVYLRKSHFPGGPEVEMVVYWPHNFVRVPIVFKMVNGCVYAFADGIETKEIEPSRIPSYFQMPNEPGRFYSNTYYSNAIHSANTLNFSTVEDTFATQLAEYLFVAMFGTQPPALPFFNRLQTALYLLRYPLLRTLNSKDLTIENLMSDNWFLVRYGDSTKSFKELVKEVYGHDSPHLLKQIGKRLYKQVDVMKQNDGQYYTSNTTYATGTSGVTLNVGGVINLGDALQAGAVGDIAGAQQAIVVDAPTAVPTLTSANPYVFMDNASLRKMLVEPSQYNVLYSNGIIFTKTIIDLSAFDIGSIVKDLLPLDYIHQVMEGAKNLAVDNMHLGYRAGYLQRDQHRPQEIGGTVIRGLHSVRDFLNRYDHKKMVKLLTTANGYNELRDTADQYETHPEKIPLLLDFKDLKEVHDYVSREFGKIKEPKIDFEYPDHVKKIDGLEVEGLRIELAKHSHILIDWGQEMHNCIGGYAKRVAQKECILLGLYEGSKIKYNIEVKSDGVKQFVAEHNRNITGKIREEVTALIIAHELPKAVTHEGITSLNQALVGGYAEGQLIIDNGAGYINAVIQPRVDAFVVHQNENGQRQNLMIDVAGNGQNLIGDPV